MTNIAKIIIIISSSMFIKVSIGFSNDTEELTIDEIKTMVSVANETHGGNYDIIAQALFKFINHHKEYGYQKPIICSIFSTLEPVSEQELSKTDLFYYKKILYLFEKLNEVCDFLPLMVPMLYNIDTLQK